jgi:uncharacterized tellurite resistance protein B-like protein
MSLWSTLGFESIRDAPPEGGSDAVARIASALQRLPPERARYLAGFAYLLGRVAHADQHLSPEETRAMRRLVSEHGDLDAGEVELAVEMAQEQARLFGATENFVVARELQGSISRDQKLALIDCLFAVGAADETISTLEDNEIRRISSELRLTHGDFISVRRKYRDQLGVLKAKPGAR